MSGLNAVAREATTPDAELRFDSALLARRLAGAANWVGSQSGVEGPPTRAGRRPARGPANPRPILEACPARVGIRNSPMELDLFARCAESETRSFASACHGAGRAMSRHQAARQWRGRKVVDELAARGILICSPSTRGVAAEAPGAYKDVTTVVDAAEAAGLARKVARLAPLVCVKG